MMATIVKKENLLSVFPNICNLAAIAQLIPASTADCERGFSALNRIKTPLRNRLSNKITVQLLLSLLKVHVKKTLNLTLHVWSGLPRGKDASQYCNKVSII